MMFSKHLDKYTCKIRAYFNAHRLRATWKKDKKPRKVCPIAPPRNRIGPSIAPGFGPYIYNKTSRPGVARGYKGAAVCVVTDYTRKRCSTEWAAWRCALTSSTYSHTKRTHTFAQGIYHTHTHNKTHRSIVYRIYPRTCEEEVAKYGGAGCWMCCGE